MKEKIKRLKTAFQMLFNAKVYCEYEDFVYEKEVELLTDKYRKDFDIKNRELLKSEIEEIKLFLDRILKKNDNINISTEYGSLEVSFNKNDYENRFSISLNEDHIEIEISKNDDIHAIPSISEHVKFSIKIADDFKTYKDFLDIIDKYYLDNMKSETNRFLTHAYKMSGLERKRKIDKILQNE